MLWLRDCWDYVAWRWRRWRGHRAWVKAGRPELKPLRLPSETWDHPEFHEWLEHAAVKPPPQPDDYIIYVDPPGDE